MKAILTIAQILILTGCNMWFEPKSVDRSGQEKVEDSCSENISKPCGTNSYPATKIYELEVPCTVTEKQSSDDPELVGVTQTCIFPDLSEKGDYHLTIPFQRIPRFGTGKSTFYPHETINQISGRNSTASVTAYITPEERLSFSSKTYVYTYQSKVGETIEQICDENASESVTLHAAAKILPSDCNRVEDCVEHSQYSKSKSCLEDTISFRLDARQEAQDNNMRRIGYYCEFAKNEFGSSYCSAGGSPPLSHYKVCKANSCTIELREESKIIKE